MSALPAEIQATPVFVAPDRFVTIRLYSALSGFTEKAIRRKIESGVWIERREWI